MKTALVIEDNPDNMLLICDILEMSGYRVLKADTGNMGCEIAKAEKPDFILLDIQLPDIDGYCVMDMIRKDVEMAHIPVVAMTSYAMAGDRERLISCGCSGYVEKPIDPNKVIAQINTALGESR
ncbi:response regulator [Teredinibacter haidensis]|uniref:response regulator n=1 Tax=Teredinibacter haidensis TaxID=2731755 RepID=UPI000948EFCA|nr:response regulator [Teredinibacter haidensis]